MANARVVVADDEVLIREGIVSVLARGGLEVLGQAGDAGTLVQLVETHRPDVAVIDIRMPPTHTTEGLDAAKTIRDRWPDVGILVLSAYLEVEPALALIATGERIGYLLKGRVTDATGFVDTVSRVADGDSVVDPDLVRELIHSRGAHDPLADLTAREREVLGLMAEGCNNVGIARRLWVTEGTVEKHVRSILSKLSLPETGEHHRRVLAVLTFLDHR